MISRQKLIDAAARVYGEFGFRGATTRRIADEAGVNEVTLFRLFGSKSQLIAEAIQRHAPQANGPSALPDEPVEPLQELTRWCSERLTHLRESRSLIRKTLSELEEHPEMAPCMSAGPRCSYGQLRRYAELLGERNGIPMAEQSSAAAAAMLMGALFADAMGRDMMPDTFPQPEDAAPELYASIFLRALGCPEGESASRRHESSPARRRVSGSSRRN